jgi:LPXTG-motif cell wall-anchored protein
MVSEPVPPPLPGAAAGVSEGFNPLYLLLGAAAIGALAYFLLKKKNHHDNSPA